MRSGLALRFRPVHLGQVPKPLSQVGPGQLGTITENEFVFLSLQISEEVVSGIVVRCIEMDELAKSGKSRLPNVCAKQRSSGVPGSVAKEGFRRLATHDCRYCEEDPLPSHPCRLSAVVSRTRDSSERPDHQKTCGNQSIYFSPSSSFPTESAA